MRFDIPNELPRKRDPELPATLPLEPSPVERRRVALNEQAEHPRALNLPRAGRQARVRLEIPDTGSREVPHDQRPQRDRIPPQVIGMSLRAEELKLLAEVGRFRVIATRDLAETVYGNRPSRLERDLTFLRQHGLVQVDTVQARRDGKRGQSERIEVVTLTRAGREIAQQTSGLPEGQRFYAGLVKPREVEHDSQIYRAYQKEAERIERAGGTNLRVQLDFELKGKIQKAIYAARKADPERDMSEIKQQVARQFDLPFVNDGIQIPDARIEYDLAREGDQEMDQGSRTGHDDIEVLTAAYRPGHLRNKAQAGFHVYASSSDRATLTAKVEGEHHLLDNVLEL
jgi:hypothetical protein